MNKKYLITLLGIAIAHSNSMDTEKKIKTEENGQTITKKKKQNRNSKTFGRHKYGCWVEVFSQKEPKKQFSKKQLETR